MASTVFIGLASILLAIFVLVLLKRWVEKRITTQETTSCSHSNQTADIWNISGRVNHQDAVTSEPQRWPTHDHHVSVDSFVVPESFQPHKKDRIPPPPYTEVDLPTYEQAIAAPRPKDELASAHIAASSSRSGEGQTS